MRVMAWLRPLALAAALVALGMLILSGPLVRFDIWSYRTGLTVFRWSAYAGIAAALLAVVALVWPSVRARGVALPVIALVLGVVSLYPPVAFLKQARAVPPINDITTDTENPPRYMTTTRAYPGAEFASSARPIRTSCRSNCRCRCETLLRGRSRRRRRWAGKWSGATPPPA